jgi:hypothetical protein
MEMRAKLMAKVKWLLLLHQIPLKPPYFPWTAAAAGRMDDTEGEKRTDFLQGWFAGSFQSAVLGGLFGLTVTGLGCGAAISR